MIAAYHASKVVPFGAKLRSNMTELKGAIEKCEEIGEAFEYFTKNEWVFENNRATQLFYSPLLTDSDRATFNYDANRISWEPYMMNFAYGIKRFILHEEAEQPSVGYNDVIRVRYFNFDCVL